MWKIKRALRTLRVHPGFDVGCWFTPTVPTTFSPKLNAAVRGELRRYTSHLQPQNVSHYPIIVQPTILNSIPADAEAKVVGVPPFSEPNKSVVVPGLPDF